MDKKTIIEFNNFSFKYNAQVEPTLHNINLKINEGEKILIIGQSGSGKSTIAHAINGLIPFAYKGDIDGHLLIDGKETRDMSIFGISKIVGTVLQDSDGQFVAMNVAEDIAFALENDNVKKNEMVERVFNVSKIVGMEKHLTHAPDELSGGQKQRVAMAGILVDNVKVLLFDEPLANLDPATGKSAIELIDDLQKRTGATVIIIEHRLEDCLYKKVDRIILVDDGKIISDGTPDDIISKNILIENGIREPLYITALKYAGVEIKKQMKPDNIEEIILSDDDKNKIRSWYDNNNSENTSTYQNHYNSNEEISYKFKQKLYKNINIEKLSANSFEEIIADSNIDTNIVLENKINTNVTKLLKISNLDFTYQNGFHALKNINLEINKGEMVSIVGTNGAGKSTFAKVLVRFERQQKGDIFLYNENINDLSIKQCADKIGYVMQNPNQMISKSMIYDEVAFGLRNKNISEDEIKNKVYDTLKICGLYPFRKWPISALSFGQKKRVTIASIFALGIDIIILDEPTAGQDYKHYTEIMEFLKKLNEDGITIIMITHDMHLMIEYADRAVVFSDGKIIADDKPSKIINDLNVINEASLKKTSLYDLGLKVGIDDLDNFTESFIYFDRKVRGHD